MKKKLKKERTCINYFGKYHLDTGKKRHVEILQDGEEKEIILAEDGDFDYPMGITVNDCK